MKCHYSVEEYLHLAPLFFFMLKWIRLLGRVEEAGPAAANLAWYFFKGSVTRRVSDYMSWCSMSSFALRRVDDEKGLWMKRTPLIHTDPTMHHCLYFGMFQLIVKHLKSIYFEAVTVRKTCPGQFSAQGS